MFGKERQDIGVLAILMCQTTVLIILYDVQRQIHNQKVVIQMRGKDSGRPYNDSDDGQI